MRRKVVKNTSALLQVYSITVASSGSLCRRACARAHATTHPRTRARTHTPTHAPTHARTHARTHVPAEPLCARCDPRDGRAGAKAWVRSRGMAALARTRAQHLAHRVVARYVFALPIQPSRGLCDCHVVNVRQTRRSDCSAQVLRELSRLNTN